MRLLCWLDFVTARYIPYTTSSQTITYTKGHDALPAPTPNVLTFVDRTHKIGWLLMVSCLVYQLASYVLR